MRLVSRVSRNPLRDSVFARYWHKRRMSDQVVTSSWVAAESFLSTIFSSDSTTSSGFNAAVSTTLFASMCSTKIRKTNIINNISFLVIYLDMDREYITLHTNAVNIFYFIMLFHFSLYRAWNEVRRVNRVDNIFRMPPKINSYMKRCWKKYYLFSDYIEECQKRRINMQLWQYRTE